MGQAILAEDELRLITIQVQRAPMQALRRELAREDQCLIEHLADLIAQFPAEALVQIQAGRLHLIVGEALAAADDAFGKAGLDHLEPRRDGHPGRHGEAVHPFAQAAQFARKALGQHGNAFVREIHGGAPGIGLLVQGPTLPHVVAHIGDMDAQDPASALFWGQYFQADGVIEILGRGRIHRDREQLAQVLTRPLLWPRPLGRTFGLVGLRSCSGLTPLAPFLGDFRGKGRQARP